MFYLREFLTFMFWLIVIVCGFGMLISNCDTVNPTEIQYITVQDTTGQSMFNIHSVLDTVIIYPPVNLSNSMIVKRGYEIVSVIGDGMVDTIAVPQFSMLTARYNSSAGKSYVRDTISGNWLHWRIR